MAQLIEVRRSRCPICYSRKVGRIRAANGAYIYLEAFINPVLPEPILVADPDRRHLCLTPPKKD